MIPGSPEWARVVSASKVAAILGLSPWESPRTMWHKMRGEIPSDDGSNAEAKGRGHYLEDAILGWWVDQHHDRSLGGKQVQLWHEDWAVATLDATGEDEHGNEVVVEAKSAASDDDWGRPGTDEVPAYYAAQVMWSMHIAGRQIAYVPVLFGRPRLAFAEYVIEYDEALAQAIVSQCRAFYDSLSDDTAAPALSDHVAEYDAIRTAHPDIDRDADATIPDVIAHRYLLDLAHEQRAAASKARVLDAMGRARRAISESGLVVARRQPKGDAVTLVRVAALPELGA